jgi:predicted Zn-dependent protease
MPGIFHFRTWALPPLSIALSALCLWAPALGASGEFDKALAILKEGRPAEALPLLEAARERQPGDPDVLYNLAGCYFSLNRSEDGMRTAEDLAKRNPRDPAVLLAAASLLLQHGSPGKAAQILSAADALAPGNPLVLNALASAQFKAGDTGASAASLERLLANLRSTLTPETRATVAKASETAGALHDGEPSSLHLAMLAAEFDLAAEHPKEAWETLRPLETAAEGNADYYKLLALADARLDRLTEAITAGREALRLTPTRQDLLLNLAGVYQMARDNQSAMRLLQDAIRAGATSPQIYFALALSQFNFDSYEEAVRSCDRALALDPKFDRAALLKGRSFKKLSKPREAIEWLGRALKLNPACEYCRYELASTLIGENRLAEAEPLLRQVVAATPNNASAQYELGKLLNGRGDTAGALIALQAAVASDPDQDKAWYLLSRIYLRKGDKAQAEHAMAAVKEIKERHLHAAREHLAGAAKSENVLTPAQP